MRDQIFQELDKIKMPNGQSIVALDMVRALTIDDCHVQFVIEAPSAEVAGALEPLRQQAVAAVTALAGVTKTSVILTAHTGAAAKPHRLAPAPVSPPAATCPPQRRCWQPWSSAHQFLLYVCSVCHP